MKFRIEFFALGVGVCFASSVLAEHATNRPVASPRTAPPLLKPVDDTTFPLLATTTAGELFAGGEDRFRALGFDTEDELTFSSPVDAYRRALPKDTSKEPPKEEASKQVADYFCTHVDRAVESPEHIRFFLKHFHIVQDQTKCLPLLIGALKKLASDPRPEAQYQLNSILTTMNQWSATALKQHRYKDDAENHERYNASWNAIGYQLSENGLWLSYYNGNLSYPHRVTIDFVHPGIASDGNRLFAHDLNRQTLGELQPTSAKDLENIDAHFMDGDRWHNDSAALVRAYTPYLSGRVQAGKIPPTPENLQRLMELIKKQQDDHREGKGMLGYLTDETQDLVEGLEKAVPKDSKQAVIEAAEKTLQTYPTHYVPWVYVCAETCNFSGCWDGVARRYITQYAPRVGRQNANGLGWYLPPGEGKCTEMSNKRVAANAEHAACVLMSNPADLPKRGRHCFYAPGNGLEWPGQKPPDQSGVAELLSLLNRNSTDKILQMREKAEKLQKIKGDLMTRFQRAKSAGYGAVLGEISSLSKPMFGEAPADEKAEAVLAPLADALGLVEEIPGQTTWEKGVTAFHIYQLIGDTMDEALAKLPGNGVRAKIDTSKKLLANIDGHAPEEKIEVLKTLATLLEKGDITHLDIPQIRVTHEELEQVKHRILSRMLALAHGEVKQRLKQAGPMMQVPNPESMLGGANPESQIANAYGYVTPESFNTFLDVNVRDKIAQMIHQKVNQAISEEIGRNPLAVLAFQIVPGIASALVQGKLQEEGIPQLEQASIEIATDEAKQLANRKLSQVMAKAHLSYGPDFYYKNRQTGIEMHFPYGIPVSRLKAFMLAYKYGYPLPEVHFQYRGPGSVSVY